MIEKLEKELNYPHGFFGQEGEAYLTSTINFRKRVSVPKNIIASIEANIQVYRLNIEMLLQKVLSKIRVLTMKTENQTFAWLSQLRKRAQDNHNKENDTYWEDLKKLKDKNSPT